MRLLKNIISYGVTPAFFVLAIVNFMAERAGGGHQHGAHDMAMGQMMDQAANAPSIWTSMWLMYLLMGFAHIGPYLSDKKQ